VHRIGFLVSLKNLTLAAQLQVGMEIIILPSVRALVWLEYGGGNSGSCCNQQIQQLLIPDIQRRPTNLSIGESSRLL
jgi:hypothetical protein